MIAIFSTSTSVVFKSKYRTELNTKKGKLLETVTAKRDDGGADCTLYNIAYIVRFVSG